MEWTHGLLLALEFMWILDQDVVMQLGAALFLTIVGVVWYLRHRTTRGALALLAGAAFYLAAAGQWWNSAGIWVYFYLVSVAALAAVAFWKEFTRWLQQRRESRLHQDPASSSAELGVIDLGVR